MMKVRGLKKSFPSPHTDGANQNSIDVLKDISFDVHSNERLAIMGPSGGGKSTLLACLSGLEQPDQGTVEIQGRNIWSMDSIARNAFRAQTIGIVFQQFQLLDHFTALENVRLPLDLRGMAAAESDQIAKDKLDRVGLLTRQSHFPDQMSRGECQRVAIARVLAMGCPVVLADEPTGSLDAKTGTAVMDLLFESMREAHRSLVLVTHDETLANRCDRILRLSDGRLLADNSELTL